MPTPEPFAWPNGAQAAVSLSFDDGRESQLKSAIPILDRTGVKATFYLSPTRSADAAAEWRQARENGHEIGNHSMRHSCSGNFAWGVRNVLEEYTLETMAAELDEASAMLTEQVGTAPLTFAYPCGQSFVGRGTSRRSYVPVVAERFLAGRGFREEHLNRPDFCDLAKLAGTELDTLTADEMIAVAQRALQHGAWVTFAGHDVGVTKHQSVRSDDLEAFCSWCMDPSHGVWIATIAEIAAHTRDEQMRLRSGNYANGQDHHRS